MKKVLSLMLIACMMISSLAFAAVTPEMAGQELQSLGFIKGDASGNLNADDVLTREQALVTVLRLMQVENKKAKKSANFTDVPADHWAEAAINYAAEAGIVNGIGDNKFGLGRKVNTQSYLTMLLRVLGYNDANVYSTAMEKATELKILDGASNILAGAAVKRGDAFVMMYNTLNTNLANSDMTLLASLQQKTEPKADYAKAYTKETLPNFEEKADKVVITDETISFVDGRGKEITLKKNPKRVIGLYPSHNKLWYQAGGEMIARISTKASEKRMPKEIKDVEIIADTTNPEGISLEKIVALKPDLVVLSIGMGRQSDFADQIDKLNIPTVVIDNELMTDYLKWVKIISNLNGKPEIYEETLKNVVEPVNEILLKVPAEGNPKALMMAASKKPVLKAYRKGCTAGGVMHDLKAVNIADSLSDKKHDKTKGVDKVELSFEALLNNQPELILLKHSSKTKDPRKLVADTLGSNPVWASYDAVKADMIYDLPAKYFHYKPLNKYNEAYEYMAKILYPEIFGEQSKDYEKK